ncbi:MAG TPA: glutamate--cysteine ligase [Pseudonocardia sp.]|jgi:carboxylate-amine ligase|nr:glutamate--cysteine ligase [Pseudonocardia sp.]
MTHRKIGVEEEFLLIDPDSGRPTPVAESLLHTEAAKEASEVESELHCQQIETATPPCATLEELGSELVSARRRAADATRAAGAELAALGTSPLAVQAEVFPARRYRKLARRFGLMTEDQLTCGCHVHVEITDEAEGVGVLDRIRPWLSVLLALSANSPYWQDAESGYASYRSQVWSRWPSAGITELFGSPEAYHRTVRAMLETGTILDEGMVYFDARLSRQFSTVEIRVADVCLLPGDAALLGALTRALVDTAAREWHAGRPAPPIPVAVLRLAAWRAGRHGLTDELVDPITMSLAPATKVLDTMLAHLEESLESYGDLEAVREMLADLIGRGNGAARQQREYRRTGQLTDVVKMAVRTTAG